MEEKKKIASEMDTSRPARATIAKMSNDERREVQALIQKTLDERDLPRFRAGLLKLGFSETSAEFARLLQLWDEFARPTHG